jgi:glycosyltransferase involved in cell wall biosynthesis
MNILLINHYAGSPHHGMEFRPYYMAREWVKLGHRVTIVASAFSHLRKEANTDGRYLTKELIDGIQYIWLNTPRYTGNGVRRAINIFSFVTGLAFNQKRITGDKVDIVIASSTYPLDIIPAWLIAERHKAKLIFEVHDLWPLSPIELGGMSKWHPFIMTMQFAEDFACRRADAVVSMLPRADEHLTTRGMAREKFYYIPNGIIIADWEIQPDLLSETHRTTIAALKNRGLFLVGYTGAHGIANSLDALIEAASRLTDRPIAFLFVGQGPEKDRLIKKARNLDNTVFLNPVPKKAIPALLNEIDALYIGLQRQPLFRFGISPNKLMDYMMAGKPVIQAIEAGNDPVAESGCGLSVPPEDPEQIAAAIIKLLDMAPTERTAMGHRGREFILRNHDYKDLASRFVGVMEGLVHDGTRQS